MRKEADDMRNDKQIRAGNELLCTDPAHLAGYVINIIIIMEKPKLL